MKIAKKLTFGLSILVGLIVFVFSLLQTHPGFAAAPSVTLGNDFTFVNNSVITGTVDGTVVTFHDADPTDSNHNYAPTNIDTSTFCGPSGAYWGINLPSSVDLSSASISGTVLLGYHLGNSCDQIPAANITNGGAITISNTSGAGNSGFSYDGSGNIVSTTNSSDVYKPAANATDVYIGAQSNGACETNGVIITDGSNTGTEYALSGLTIGRAGPTNGPALTPSSTAGQYLNTPGNCVLSSTNTISISGNPSATSGSSVPVGGACSGGTDSVNGACTSAGGDCTAASTAASCDSHANDPFSWIICPLMSMADEAAGQFNTFVSQQLCFSTGTTSSTGGVVCQGNDNLTDGVHNAWNIFKNLASAVLVIILLVAVISQALGGGPLDAYTIRKILPKIVIAVIVMQLSWVLLKWSIDLANDIGSGINSLMLAPFGGSDNITLSRLTGGFDLSNQNAAVTTGVAAFSFFAALAAVAIVSIPGLLLMALYVVLALLTAFAVLLLRKMLIIFLVILAPVAFVLWILPGTERYWKLWSSNFMKLLLMYPMIMGMIAAGKIFATVASGNTATIFNPHLAIAHLGGLPIPHLAAFSNFVDLIVIIGAWFMPYFLLPKTFSWGGSALGAAHKGVANMTERAGKPANEYLKWRQGLSPWKQARTARRAEQERRAHHGFYQGLNSEGIRGNVRRARLGGVPIPNKAGLQRERDLRGRVVENAQSEIDKHVREEDQRATIDLTRRLLPQYHADDHDDIREAILQGKKIMVHAAGEERIDATGKVVPPTHEFDGAAYGHDPHRLRAAADRALVHGQMGAVDQYYTEAMASGDAARIAEATRFKDDNAAALGDKLTHVLKGYGVAVASTAEGIAQMSGHEIESVLAKFTTDIATRVAAGDTAGAARLQEQLDGFVERHGEALRNPALRGRVDLRGTAAVNAYEELRTSSSPADPATVAARATIDEINNGTVARATGRSDREANRSRYRTPDPTTGLPDDRKTIPLIKI